MAMHYFLMFKFYTFSIDFVAKDEDLIFLYYPPHTYILPLSSSNIIIP